MNIKNIKGIEESQFYMVFLSKNYINDIDCLEMDLYAKHLKKPFIIVRIHDIPLPERLVNAIIIANIDIVGGLTDENKIKFGKEMEKIKKKWEEKKK